MVIEGNLKKRRRLQKQRKLLFMLASTITLATTAVAVNAKSKDETILPNNHFLDLNAGASKAIHTEVVLDYLEPESIDNEVGIIGNGHIEEAEIMANGYVEEKEMIEGREYYDVPCPINLQNHIYNMGEKYVLDHKLMFVILDQESDGHWNNNGIVSITNDYGVAQINKCNADYVMEKFGWTMEEIQHDPYKCIEVQASFLKDMMVMYGYTIDNYDLANMCGTYNGWIDWRESDRACEYVRECLERNDRIFDEVLVRTLEQ